ncbi:MAG TPA: SAM-dependent methyltransferase [Alphaproteobacteria bacterium]|nr:SAM-dependent methyltransferase [Alphaproteobacteria bacterium]
MNPLARHLVRRIAAEGPLSLAAYMAECLLHPEHGYYTGREPFGAAGDFTTAPEISQMFGELLGLWCVQAWLDRGAPSPVHLVELGPGRGTLMADAWRAAGVVPAFRAAARIHLVEASPRLRERQAAALAGAPASWHDGLDDVPEGPTLLLANEFFDALPIHQYVRGRAGWHERRVDWEEGRGLRFVLDPQPAAVPLPLAAPEGSLVETSPAAAAVAAGIAARLVRDGGAALIVDYGYDRPAFGDTFQALRRHRPADPLEAPGERDLTAHVDFPALAAAARAAGAAAFGPLTQGALLERLGIRERAGRLAAAAPDRAESVRAAAERLTGAEAMGTLFKALALGRPADPPPPAFA